MDRILVVDDEEEIVRLIKMTLEEAGYKVSTAADGESGLKLIGEKDFTLILLDIMMPGLNGIEVCKTIRQTKNIPIIIISAKGMECDKIKGLMTGADDYLVKPFSMKELAARVQAQIRRFTYFNQNSCVERIMKRKGLLVDEEKRTVEVYGKPVKLTPTEFEILLLLVKHPGQVFSSEQIYRQLWEETYFEGNNTVMAHMWRLREKIELDSKNPQIIETVWGAGYKIGE